MKFATREIPRRPGTIWTCLALILALALLSSDESSYYSAGVVYSDDGETYTAYLPILSKSRHWTDCSQCRFGSVVMTVPDFSDSTGPELVSLAQDGYTGLAASPTYHTALEYFPSLDGWDKAHICNSLECLRTRVSYSLRDGLAYSHLAYGPERLDGVPDAEKYNLPWATAQARDIAGEAGKALMISYSTTQLHQEAEERGFGWENVGEMVSLLAGYGDVWLIQAADEYNDPYSNPDHPDPILSQRHFTPGPEWRAEVEKWVNWIRTANPEIEIWIQLALHRIPTGAPPWEDNYPSAELALEYREWLLNPAYGPPLVDGVYLSSIYSWAIDSVIADQEMEKAIRLACAPAPPAPAAPAPVPEDLPSAVGEITLVGEGWTDDLVLPCPPSGECPTILPGYYYRIYDNSGYACGSQGNHQFMVLDQGTDPNTPKHLFAKFLGGAVGFWYYDGDSERVYYPNERAVGILTEANNRNMFFRTSVSEEYANGVTKRFRNDAGFRMLVLSYCSHDLYHGRGEYDDTDGFSRWGYAAAMAAVDYVQANFNTDRIITYGGSAGAAGAFYVGKDQDGVAGIIMDSQAVDLSAISDACYAGTDPFGGAFPCFCPDGGLTCMEVLAPRIGFGLGQDEPHHSVEQGEIDTPIYLVWNYHDASRYAHLQYDNLHNAIRQHDPGGHSVACRVCLPNNDPEISDSCIADDSHAPIGACSLHVPSGQDYTYTIQLVEDIYDWALSRVGSSWDPEVYLPLIYK